MGDKKKQEIKKWQDLTIRDDFMFSKVMQDESICKDVVELLLGIKIDKVEYIKDQKVIDIIYEQKSIRLDIYMKTEDVTYNVEMQTKNKYNNAKRSRYYQSLNDLHELKKGLDYNQLSESYLLFICTFDPFGKKQAIYHFENMCVLEDEKETILLKDGMHKIFFNTNAYDKAKKESLKKFLKYIEDGSVDQRYKLIKKLEEKVTEVKTSKGLEREFMRLELLRQDTLNEGAEQKAVQIAKNLLDILDDETIAEKTGLFVEEVKQLRKEIGT